MLTRLKVKNFRLLRDVTLELEEDVPTVFIGPNSAGKSTVLEVLDLLHRFATEGFEQAISAHGGIRDIRRRGAKEPIEIETHWTFTARSGEKGELKLWKLAWVLKLDAVGAGSAVIAAESLHDHSRVLVQSEGTARIATDESLSKPPGQRAAHVSLGNVESAVSAVVAAMRFRRLTDPRSLAFSTFADRQSFPGLALLRSVLSECRIMGAFSAAPPWARRNPEAPSARDSMVISTEAFVGREGVGLATALYNLQLNHADSWERLERALRGEFPFVRRVVFPPDAAGARIAFAVEDTRFPGEKIFSSQMSDGMITYLCLLVMILHPQQGGALGLDEPDAHLHPSALRRLLSLAHEPHDRRRLLIVTHSNTLLDELRDPARSIRVVESTPEGAVIRKLDAVALDAWRKDYTLSEMRRTGLLDPPNTAYGNDP